mmetsp:Transcript_2705/g.6966  ORF Transcript_2705/g.6966 Transcript_2705/m.6966 type:complete len:307 (+) Transcript_2705:85-1005(+)
MSLAPLRPLIPSAALALASASDDGMCAAAPDGGAGADGGGTGGCVSDRLLVLLLLRRRRLRRRRRRRLVRGGGERLREELRDRGLVPLRAVQHVDQDEGQHPHGEAHDEEVGVVEAPAVLALGPRVVQVVRRKAQRREAVGHCRGVAVLRGERPVLRDEVPLREPAAPRHQTDEGLHVDRLVEALEVEEGHGAREHRGADGDEEAGEDHEVGARQGEGEDVGPARREPREHHVHEDELGGDAERAAQLDHDERAPKPEEEGLHGVEQALRKEECRDRAATPSLAVEDELVVRKHPQRGDGTEDVEQ